MDNDVYYERDSRLIPYLFSCVNEVRFIGTKTDGQTIYFGFTPKEKAVELINQYYLKQNPYIPAKSLFDAIDEFRTILYREKLSHNKEQ